jgi:signal transduction histidine kinase
MPHAKLERWSLRAALALGFCVTLGLWLYTGYEFSVRINAIRDDADSVAIRYTRAQDQLATLRGQLLSDSVRARDALFDPRPATLASQRSAIEASNRAVRETLDRYEPFLDAAAERPRIGKLRVEVERFHAALLSVIDDAVSREPGAIREVLDSNVVPQRESAFAVIEEVERGNRVAFIEQQAVVRETHRVAEADSRRRLGIALVIGLGVLLLTSLYAWRLEERLRRQMVRDAKLSTELQQTAAKVLNAQEEERRTIARELHDEVGQVLTAIRVELDVAQRALESEGRSAAMLAEAQTITNGAVQTVRNLAQLLHPAALDDLGLPAVIDASLRGLARRYNIRGEFHQSNLPPRLPREVELAAYRIVQEGLTNIAKHAQATECHVRLTRLTDRLLLEVEDNGIGFVDDTDRPIVARGLGLVSVRERAVRLGGTFNILSNPGEGTRLIVTFPEKVQYA